MYTPLEGSAAKPLENPYHQVTLLAVEDCHVKNGIILMTYFFNFISIQFNSNHFYRTNCQQVPHCILPLGASVHRALMLATFTEVRSISGDRVRTGQNTTFTSRGFRTRLIASDRPLM